MPSHWLPAVSCPACYPCCFWRCLIKVKTVTPGTKFRLVSRWRERERERATVPPNDQLHFLVLYCLVSRTLIWYNLFVSIPVIWIPAMANVYSYDTVASYSSSSSTPSSLRRPFRPLPPYQLDPWPLVCCIPSSKSNFPSLSDPLSLSQIWKKLDPRSFTVVQRVCKMWKSKCMLSNVASSILEVYLNAASRMLEEMAHLTKALSAYVFHVSVGISQKWNHFNDIFELRYDIEATGDEKISEYFKETLEEIRNFLRLVRSRSSDLASNASFLLFYTSLEYRLETALYTLRTTRRVSQSLDLVEFSLRRSFLQLASTFPLEHGRWSPKHSYSSIISDKHAKSLWKSMAGANKPWISFKKASSQFSPRFTPFLRIILDFPSDHYISAFKWNAFTSSFGPFSHIERNINRFMFGPGGFCGFINRAHAERILMDSPKKSVLVRASRTHSSLMALSYRPPTGEIVHITSNRNFWTMKDFASTLESISKQKGVIPHSCNVYVLILPVIEPVWSSGDPFLTFACTFLQPHRLFSGNVEYIRLQFSQSINWSTRSSPVFIIKPKTSTSSCNFGLPPLNSVHVSISHTLRIQSSTIRSMVLLLWLCSSEETSASPTIFS